jgi:ABC-type spermidine/putrescine transport system permease subunit II
MKRLPQAPKTVQLAVIFILLLPFVPILWSFAPFVTQENYFIEAFRKLFSRNELIDSLLRSLKIAFLSATLAVFIACVAAWRVEKHQDRLVARSLHLSMALPEIVLGISLLMAFSLIGIRLGSLTVTLAHASFSYAYATLIIRSHTQNLDPKIFEAAKDLGATPSQRLFKISLPLFSSSLIAAFLLSATLSLDDYLIAVFTTGAGQDTLPMRIYGLMRYGFGPELKAISLLLFSTSLVFVLIGLKVFLKKSKN